MKLKLRVSCAILQPVEKKPRLEPDISEEVVVESGPVEYATEGRSQPEYCILDKPTFCAKTYNVLCCVSTSISCVERSVFGNQPVSLKNEKQCAKTFRFPRFGVINMVMLQMWKISMRRKKKRRRNI